ncbi:MAG TPA: DUF559 domain-containing protein [Stellaceae bacterium]|nr:DUF559 domain-containing protein [Stellaceae bacterium]
MVRRPRTLVARRLRRNATEVEKRLWRALRELLPEYRFRRQHPIGPYVVDFACPSRKIAIELDGGQHTTQQQADASRTRELGEHGYRVIRFWNGDVLNNIVGVVESVHRELVGNAGVDPLRPSGGEGGARRGATGG